MGVRSLYLLLGAHPQEELSAPCVGPTCCRNPMCCMEQHGENGRYQRKGFQIFCRMDCVENSTPRAIDPP